MKDMEQGTGQYKDRPTPDTDFVKLSSGKRHILSSSQSLVGRYRGIDDELLNSL